MNVELKRSVTALLLLLLTVVGRAESPDSCITLRPGGENQLQFDLQLLTQGEIRNGGLAENDKTERREDYSNFLYGRTRFTIGYQRPFLEAKVTIQHEGIWGQSGLGGVNVYEAWAKLSAKNGLFAQIGRQALSYDDERIIGPNDWAMAAMSYDVLKLGYEGHGHKAHLLLAYNQNEENVDKGGTYYAPGSGFPYKTMQTLWYHYDVPRFPLGASFIFMNVGMQGGEEDGSGMDAPRTEWQQLAGCFLKATPKHWSLEASYYRQFGKDEHGMKLAGWMASIKTTWETSARLTLDAGFDYLSGDKYFPVPGEGSAGLIYHDVNRGFFSVYGSHHKFYGAMDFFYIRTFVQGFSPGLQNLYFGGNVRVAKPLSLEARYHYMAMATKLPNLNQTLGHELELGVSLDICKYVTLVGGFSYMTGTDTMERLKRASGKRNLRWSWITLVVSPRLLSLKF